MQFLKRSISRVRRGSVLVISIIFVMVFSALAVSMAAMSGNNLQISDNQQNVNRAQQAAESGLQVVRYWFERITIPGTMASSARFDHIASSLQSDLSNNEISNIVLNYDSSTITIPAVTLDSGQSQNFSAVIQSISDEITQIEVTGTYGSITRTIRFNYNYGQRANSVFDYGVATRGALSLSGNVQLEGVNVSIESDVYIESTSQDDALSISGNSQIAGDVKIVNPDAYVTLEGSQAGIGGETGQDAIDNHVSIGDEPVEFPTPNPAYFEQYIQNTYDPSLTVFENIVIPAGTNPSFAGGVVLNGIVFIETPNVVTFTGNAIITGLVVGNGDLTDNSGTNQIIFEGTVDSYPVGDLPVDQSQFDGLRNETGTFIMAPGFSTSFGGNLGVVNGAIIANGIGFSGNGGGTINGSVVNYSDTAMILSGNTDLYFNRSGVTEIPAGFEPEIILYYDSDSYCEPVF